MRRAASSALLLLALAGLVFSTALTRPAAQGSQTTDEQINLILDRVVRLRGLESRGPVAREFMKRDDLRDFYRASFFEENPIEDIETSQQLLELLGFVDAGMSVLDLLIDVLSEEVLGFYDRDKKTVYVVSERDRLGPNDIITMAHELTHALQDQHYDLKGLYAARKGDNDRQLALQALVEGDASLLHSLYSLRHLSDADRAQAERAESSQGRALDRAPFVIQRELIFPYEDGVGFLLGPFMSGSWPAIDAIWRDPPESTEQILHPEKYRAREKPVQVILPDVAAQLARGWRQLDEDNLGELDWQILIQQFTDEATAKRAAAGWGGDRYQLLRRDTDGALVFATRTAWDTVADAVEFFDAYQRLAAGRHGTALRVGAAPTGVQGADAAWGARAGDLHHAMARDGAMVTLVVTNSEDGLAALPVLRSPEAIVLPASSRQEALLP